MRALTLGIPIVLGGCLLGGPPPGGEEGENPDLADYDRLVEELATGAEVVLGPEADELEAQGERLYWLEYRGQWDPTLHSLQDGVRVDYQLELDGDRLAWRGGDKVIVTAQVDGGVVRYVAWAADRDGEALGELELPVPGGEQRFWAYAVTGNDVYLAMTGAETAIVRWRPGSEPVIEVVLEDLGMEVGELWAIGAYGRVLFVIESGRLWRIDLEARSGRWLPAETEVSGTVSTDGRWVVYRTALGPLVFDAVSGEVLDLKAAIDAADFRINETFREVHRYAGGAMAHAGGVVYRGWSGVFHYGFESGEVTPVLLDPRVGPPWIDYVEPQVTRGGTVYVTGLESDNGAVGADGPVYAVELPDALD
jgi:hypothetical protein